MTTGTDARFLARMGERPARSGDELARGSVLRALVGTYAQPLGRYFRRRLASADEAEDMVQEVFLRLSRYDDPAGIRQPEHFLFVTAANVLRDRARREAVRGGPALSIDGIDLPSSDIAPDRVLESREAAARIRDALAELPERTRDVFVLRLMEGLKMADVARAFGISTRAAEKHQARALAHVAMRLEDWRLG